MCRMLLKEQERREDMLGGRGEGHSFNKYLLSSYHVLVPMLGMGNLEMDPAQYHPKRAYRLL